MTDDFDRHYGSLLARRVPREDVVIGRAYVIHARNGGVGVAIEQEGRLGYRLHREKSGDHFLFVEWDWDEGPPHGTAFPLSPIALAPPADEDELLAWLAERETDLRAEIAEAQRELFSAMGLGAVFDEMELRRDGARDQTPPSEASDVSRRGSGTE
ncbi:MAG: hypothetical protein KF729_04950 [Sandaracinaceae bacterium]|nr:hypothetical protein [Sandaracinaceae bacterium]